ncbi:MAG: LLM class flavin-dependent oxidoreductase [Acidimicrobiales bacterium]|mgnify:CR=1 FL=1|nr:LLM class flavin-dependent oxidoreductase [Acidimicrobiales bacterium]
MDFNHFLSSYYPDPTYGGDRLYADMLEQAVAAERLGYRGVTLPEHHLINVLITPSPLLMAVKVGAMTERIELVTSVVVLPLHDMRVLAGEISQADILTDLRLIVGVGRGAFAYEMARMGSPIEESRQKFDESLNVLVALLTGEEVEWHGDWYDFDPLTIMPPPVRQPVPLMVAVMNPEGIAACTRRGFNIQTTPLSGAPELFLAQVSAHKEAKADMGDTGDHLRLMMSRVAYCAEDSAHARRMLERAHDYYGRFDNVFSGPGLVTGGCIDPLPCATSLEELDEALIICPPDEMVDRLAEYHEAGVDEVILSSNMGQPQAEHLEAMERFATEVMPHFNPSTLAAT